MNNMFVYRGILVLFDELVGWFCYDKNGNKWSFDDKEILKSFIDKKLFLD